jgi:lycopene beta-cyclase
MAEFDVILVGGGLANCLIAMRLAAERPELKVAVIEAGARLGGNHTWSFHQTDVTPEQDRWLAPIVARSWPAQEVSFPAFRRRLETGYRSIASTGLERHVAELGGIARLVGTRVDAVEADGVVVAGGQRFAARCVIDGRGLRWVDGVAFGYQKFVGLEVALARPHGLSVPLIMDATVAQIDGYRFVYCLPYDETRLLIEDTYYADAPPLDVGAVTRRIHDYAAALGWTIAAVERDETGVLPITLEGSLDAFWPAAAADIARSGMRAGLFHQTTGYSLPLAVEVADLLARIVQLTTAEAARAIRRVGVESWERQAYFRLLNRLLFISARPDERRDVMQRFYRLPAGLIERFYAGRPTTIDKLQILSGRPPISILRAAQGMSPASARPRRRGAGGPAA